MRPLSEEILQVVRSSERHMTADEIYLTCRARGINISMATVYRNLGILADANIIRRVSMPGKPDCFDVTLEEHGHKVCEVCGEISDVDVGDLKSELEKRLGITIVDYDLCLRYVCPACRDKKKNG